MTKTKAVDEQYMLVALQEAEKAKNEGEVPVGAVVVMGNRILAVAHNEKEKSQDPTAHAEILALRRAAAAVGSWRLTGASMYVTLEPCAMCAGAMVQARIERLIFGAFDSKAGAAGSVIDILDLPGQNHRVRVRSGILADRAEELLKSFFEDARRGG